MKTKNKIVTIALLSSVLLSLSANAKSFINQTLLIMSEKERKIFFENSISNCSVKKTFYQGKDNSGAGYWNYSCKDIKTSENYDFVVRIDDKDDTVKMVPCFVLEKIAGQKCFTKFKGQ